MNMPLYDALRTLEKENTLRMHMPGHKGRGLSPAFEGLSGLDFTELEPTGNLYSTQGPVYQAELLAAKAWGAETACFCTNGSTGAVHAALMLACPAGSRLIMERGCHKSVFTAAAVLDLECEYLWEVSADTVESALEKGGAAVCINSPDYYGLCKDIPAIAAVCRRYGAKLIVDEAHGAHLPFMEGYSGAAALGADLACTSMHKTLPALGQTALVTSNGTFGAAEIKHALSLLCTSSPCYALMASMDAAREYMEKEGRESYGRAASRVDDIRRDFPCLPSSPLRDPCRLTVLSKDGFKLGEELEKLGIYPELCDEDKVVFIVTGMDTDEDFDRLRGALSSLSHLLGLGELSELPAAEAIISPGAAFRCAKSRAVLKDSVGKVCGQIVAPYPPAKPLLTWGEEISQKHIAYLAKKRYNILDKILIVEHSDGI